MCFTSWWDFVYALNTAYSSFDVGISPSLYGWKDSEKLALQLAVIVVNWSSRGLSLVERNLKKGILLTMSSCIISKDVYMWIVVYYRRYSRGCTVHAVKAVRQLGDLIALNWSSWLKYYSFFVVKLAGYFSLLYFVFSLVLAKLKIWFWFSLHSSSFYNLVRFSSWAVLLTLFWILNRWYVTVFIVLYLSVRSFLEAFSRKLFAFYVLLFELAQKDYENSINHKQGPR